MDVIRVLIAGDEAELRGAPAELGTLRALVIRYGRGDFPVVGQFGLGSSGASKRLSC